MSKLIFSSDGTRLFHCTFPTNSYWDARESLPRKSFKTSVQVWHMAQSRLLYETPGYLLGLSQDGQSFLTQPAKTEYRAWKTSTGAELSLTAISPDDYALHQRTDLCTEGQVIYLKDALGQRSPQQLTAPYTPSNVALAPDDESLVITFWLDVGIADAAYGQCLDIETGAVRYEFDVGRFLSIPPVHFAAEHDLLLVGTGSGCVLHRLATGEIVGKSKNLFNTSIFCVSPTDRNLIAAGTRGNTIYLVDLTNGQKQTLKTRSGQIRAMAFHPDGVHLAIALTRGALQLWNIQSGELGQQLI